MLLFNPIYCNLLNKSILFTLSKAMDISKVANSTKYFFLLAYAKVVYNIYRLSAGSLIFMNPIWKVDLKPFACKNSINLFNKILVNIVYNDWFIVIYL